MLDTDFVPGQRWVSNTESELGLGIVVENADRRITVTFPAAGERRVYAADNAPLSRVIYNIGETVKTEDGANVQITARETVDGCITYSGLGEDGSRIAIDEIDLDSYVQFSRPLDRLFAGQIEKNAAFNLRAETLALQHAHRQSDANGLLGPRAQLLPHQYYIADEVAARFHPRVLLADEVGLGKTIEAGLILHRLVHSGRVSRVLIIVPDSLIHQWLVEMLRRFNLHFSILDDETCAAITEADRGNPFESAQLVLAGLSLFVEHPNHLAEAREANWDLLIVDEAHHLVWSEAQASDSYLAVESLARDIASLILITATPEQLGTDGHFARLRLLDPDRYHEQESFKAEQDGYHPLAAVVDRLTLPESATLIREDAAFRQQLSEYLGATVVDGLVAQGDDVDVDEVIRNLLDRHGTGRVLFRNCRDTVSGFPERKLNVHVLECPADFAATSGSLTLEDQLLPEQILGDGWMAADTRVAWLLAHLQATADDRTLLICANAATAIELETYLRTRHGVRSSVFHEEMDLIARDRAAAYFADEAEHAQILLCSEIGSEGRNFQFARHLVLFDLPLNPDLIEQRIGRLDRIGQRHTVQIHIPVYEGGAMQRLAEWYHEGLGLFEAVFPAASALLAEMEDRLRGYLSGTLDAEAWPAFLQETQNRAAEVRESLSAGRDRLLELNSYNEARATDVIEAIAAATKTLELASYMDRVFDYFGVDHQPHSALSVVVHPGDHMLCHSFPGLPEGGITATFDRTQALSTEDMHFLTWEHPMVVGAMDLMLSGEFGNATLCTLKAPFLKPGILIVESVFIVNCAAPRALQLQRYLPQGVIRVVVGPGQRDLTEILTPERIDSVVTPIKKHVAREVAKHARDEINILADSATEIAERQLAPLLVEARAQVEKEAHDDIERLRALAAVNPNIRPEEINHREHVAEELIGYLQNAQLRFDAVRVALAT